MRRLLASFVAWLYKGVLLITQASYRLIPGRIKKVSARVISIGNITWGGTGKTPFVVSLSRHLIHQGKKVAVLTRGYGRDEVDELRRALPDVPVIVGRDRVKGAREAVSKHHAEVLILDDGFQHIRLHRDLDVLNINATQPFGPGGLLPLGTLREPLEHLARAQIFVLTKSNIGSKNIHWIRQKILSIKPGAVIFEAVHKPVGLWNPRRNRVLHSGEMRGRKVAVISGIGDPFSFEKTVEMMGAQIVLAARYDDHHVYTEEELLDFARRCKEVGVREAVTTQKDFFRLQPLFRRKSVQGGDAPTFLVLQVEFQLNDEEDFLRRCLNS